MFWYGKRSGALQGFPPRAPITIAWTFHSGDPSQADVWDRFLDSTGLGILREWDNVIERIVYKHSGKAFTSIELDRRGGSMSGLVRIAGVDMRDDHWKSVRE